MSDKNKTDLPPRTAELYDNSNGLFDSFDSDWVKLAAKLERELAIAIQERDEARWEVCGFHHLTGFLSGDYAISRGWGYLNNEKKGQKFPKSVSDFNEYLKGQDKVLLEIIAQQRSDLRNSRMANEADHNNKLFKEGKL